MVKLGRVTDCIQISQFYLFSTVLSIRSHVQNTHHTHFTTYEASANLAVEIGRSRSIIVEIEGAKVSEDCLKSVILNVEEHMLRDQLHRQLVGPLARVTETKENKL